MRSASAIVALVTLVLASVMGCFHDPFQLMQGTVDWKTLESTHFRYHYLDDPEAEWRHTPFVTLDGTTFDPGTVDADTAVRRFLAVYEEWYALLSGVFPRKPSGTVDIYAWSNSAQQERLGSLLSNAAVDFGKMSGDGLAIHATYPVIPHELVHVFQFANGLASVGWTEGMAVAISGMHEVPDAKHVWSTYDFRPTVSLPGYTGEVKEPYDFPVTDNGYYSGSIHRFAAYILELDSDPAYPMTHGEAYPGLRPSQIASWVNAMTRDSRLVYVVSSSFIHYLITTRGFPRLLATFRNASVSGFAGTSLEKAFRDANGEELRDVEDEWEAWLRTRPASAWSAPVEFIDVGD